MTSLPQASNDYEAPVDMELSKAAWDAAMVDIGTRLRAVEALGSDMQAVIDAGIASGQQAIADALAPLTQQYQDQVQALLDNIAAAEDQLAALQAAGVVAENVVIEPIDGLPDVTDAQAALATLRAQVVAANEAIPAFASQAQMEAGTADDVTASPLGVAQAIAALAPAADVVQTVFTESGTFTKHADDLAYFVEAWGGGGSGGRYIGTNQAGGGGGGEYVSGWFLPAQLDASEAVTIGAGGAPVNVDGEGNDGGNTLFGALLTALGGNRGVIASGSAAAPPRGNVKIMVASSVAVMISWAPAYGARGGAAVSFSGANAPGSTGGSSLYGGAGGGGGSSSFVAPGGASHFGGDGGDAVSSGNAGDGQPRGGGGGASRDGTSGAGGRGEVRVWSFRRKS